MRTVGIDLAAQPVNTGVCVVDWSDGCVESVAPNSTAGGDDELVDVMCATGVDKVGIDTPLGWPDDFVEAVVAHHSGARWPTIDDSADHRRRLRLRLTDTVVAATTGRTPMSVSADRIAVAAMRGALVQQLLVDRTGDPAVVDRSGVSGLVAEVYPAAALAVWSLDPTGYKGTPAVAHDRRSVLLAAILDRTGLTATADQCAAMTNSDHLLDAFICAVVAKAVFDGATAPPTPDDPNDSAASDSAANGSAANAGDWSRARREGWIHVPSPTWPSQPGSSGTGS